MNTPRRLDAFRAEVTFTANPASFPSRGFALFAKPLPSVFHLGLLPGEPAMCAIDGFVLELGTPADSAS